MKIITKYLENFERYGLLNTINNILFKLSIKLRFYDRIWRKKNLISQKKLNENL